MIEYIQGKLIEKTPTYVVVDCSGVGYFIHVSLNTFTHVKDSTEYKILTHQIIREDTHQLYGFSTSEERRVFRLLISVSGVGANTARMMLSSLSSADIQKAIGTGNISMLQAIKGIGAKSAQRIIVDLKDKIGKQDTADNFAPNFSNIREEAVLALTMLGFNKSVSEKAVDKIISSEKNTISVEDIIKIALKNL